MMFCDREREIGRGDPEVARHRRQEQAEALPDPHAEAEQYRGADQDRPDLHVPPPRLRPHHRPFPRPCQKSHA
jgi:hypothetical protein